MSPESLRHQDPYVTGVSTSQWSLRQRGLYITGVPTSVGSLRHWGLWLWGLDVSGVPTSPGSLRQWGFDISRVPHRSVYVSGVSMSPRDPWRSSTRYSVNVAGITLGFRAVVGSWGPTGVDPWSSSFSTFFIRRRLVQGRCN